MAVATSVGKTLQNVDSTLANAGTAQFLPSALPSSCTSDTLAPPRSPAIKACTLCLMLLLGCWMHGGAAVLDNSCFCGLRDLSPKCRFGYPLGQTKQSQIHCTSEYTLTLPHGDTCRCGRRSKLLTWQHLGRIFFRRLTCAMYFACQSTGGLEFCACQSMDQNFYDVLFGDSQPTPTF